MGVWNGTDQEAARIFHDIVVQEYEKLIRCAVAYLRLTTAEAHLLGKAEDVVQDMLTLAWERRRDVLSKDKPVGWLYEALYYKAKELLKEESKWEKRLRKYREFYVLPAETHIDLKLELEETVPKKDFDLLCKIYVMGYSYREVCHELDLTKSALAAKVHRILELERSAPRIYFCGADL